MPVVIVLIIAVLLISGGLGSLLIGTDSVVPDRPLIAGLGGIVAIVGGCLMLGLALVLRELVALRSSRDAARRMEAQTGVPLAEPAPVRPAVFAPASPSAPGRDESALPGMAGAGALAAVAAAVGATTALSGKRDEDAAAAPESPSKPDISPHTAMDTSAVEVTAPLSAPPEIGEAVSHEERAKLLPTPDDAVPVMETPTHAQPEIEAELARESDPFNLQAEFDRLLDQAVSDAGPAEPAPERPDDKVTAPEAAADKDTGDDAEPLVKPAEPMSAEDKSQLEDLVRAAIEDAPQDDASDQLPDRPVPVVPPVATLRERIATALEPLDRLDPVPAQVPETDAEVRAETPPPQAEVQAGPAVIAPSETEPASAEPAEIPVDASASIGEAGEVASPVETGTEAAAHAASSPDEAPPASSRSIVRTFSSGANHYTMYTDGSISADTPSGRYEFASFNELRAFIDTYKG